jgi:hypothetical protein
MSTLTFASASTLFIACSIVDTSSERISFFIENFICHFSSQQSLNKAGPIDSSASVGPHIDCTHYTFDGRRSAAPVVDTGMLQRMPDKTVRIEPASCCVRQDVCGARLPVVGFQ